MITKLKDQLIKQSVSAFEEGYIKLLPKKHYLNDLSTISSRLSIEELKYLYIFVFYHKETIYVEQCDKVMARLYVKGITERNIEDVGVVKIHGYNLNSWAREYFLDNKSLFDNCILSSSINTRNIIKFEQ